jgi:hypothetical protein
VTSFDKDSKKRFKRKGFTGHVVNPHDYKLPYPPELTNHQRMAIREQARKDAKIITERMKKNGGN